MTIVRYDPFRDLRTLQEEVNREVARGIAMGRGLGGRAVRRQQPADRVHETADDARRHDLRLPQEPARTFVHRLVGQQGASFRSGAQLQNGVGW